MNGFKYNIDSFPIVNKYILLFILVFVFTSCCAFTRSRANLDSLYKCLDAAIDSSSYFVGLRQSRIHCLTCKLSSAKTMRTRYDCLFNLYEEYRSFKNDSAITYLSRCIDVAGHMGDVNCQNYCRARLAFQCSTTGMYSEALELLDAIDTTLLDKEGWHDYLIASQHLYNEMSFYTHVPWFRAKYTQKSDDVLNRIFKTFNTYDDEYLLRKQMEYYGKDDFKKAFEINNQWMSIVDKGTHRYAIAAFYRFLIFAKSGNEDEARRWLAESAITDVRLAVMDQGSLGELANRLGSEPANLQRAYKYIRFAWDAARTFNTRVRSHQVSPVLSLIEGNYQEHIARVNLRLRVLIGIACVLLIVVFGLFVYANRQRRRLQVARNELDASNGELKSLNMQLSEYNVQLNSLNEKLEFTNRSLDESNKMKELYLGRFLSLCSAYIDKTETLRRNVAKRIKNKDYDGLARIAAGKSEDWIEFYCYFDNAFLKLFPNFVADFNALLRPDERINIAADGALGTSIRIFALIRLGVDDSSKIAEFLHYSVNTIYNYRAKIKNGAIGDRNEFEKKVKEIGMK